MVTGCPIQEGVSNKTNTMNHKKHYSATKRQLGAVLTGIACLAITASTGLARTYSVTDLGILPDKKESVSAGINNSGQVTGTSSTPGNPDTSAFRYTPISKQPMEDLSGSFNTSASRGFGINESGRVVGDSTFFYKSGDSQHAALFKDGSIADLGTLPKIGNFSRANSINAFDQVVGSVSSELDGENGRAFGWSASTGIFEIGTLGGENAQAFAVNDAGFVTGNSQTVSKPLGTHAFIAQPFGNRAKALMQDLGTLGGTFSSGLSINGANHVAGYSTINNTDDRVHAFFYDGKTMIDLGSLAGPRFGIEIDQSVALGINKGDEIVGYSYVYGSADAIGTANPLASGPQQVAFIYARGVMTNLNQLIGDAAKQYLLYAASDINNQGQIAATAFDFETGTYRAVLLTPIVDNDLHKK